MMLYTFADENGYLSRILVPACQTCDAYRCGYSCKHYIPQATLSLLPECLTLSGSRVIRVTNLAPINVLKDLNPRPAL